MTFNDPLAYLCLSWSIRFRPSHDLASVNPNWELPRKQRALENSVCLNMTQNSLILNLTEYSVCQYLTESSMYLHFTENRKCLHLTENSLCLHFKENSMHLNLTKIQSVYTLQKTVYVTPSRKLSVSLPYKKTKTVCVYTLKD